MLFKKAVLVSLLVPFLIASCQKQIGYNPQDSNVATSPFGARVEFEFQREVEISGLGEVKSLYAELLDVTDEGMLVDNGTTILLLRFGTLKSAKFEDAVGKKQFSGNDLHPDHLLKAKRVARYAFGLPDDQLALLLAERGQEELIVR